MVKNGKTKRLSITVPVELLDEIAEMVPQGEMSRFLAEAARQYLTRLRQRHGLEKGFGAWSDEQHPELTNAQDTIAYVQALRRDNGIRLDILSATDEQ